MREAVESLLKAMKVDLEKRHAAMPEKDRLVIQAANDQDTATILDQLKGWGVEEISEDLIAGCVLACACARSIVVALHANGMIAEAATLDSFRNTFGQSILDLASRISEEKDPVEEAVLVLRSRGENLLAAQVESYVHARKVVG